MNKEDFLNSIMWRNEIWKLKKGKRGISRIRLILTCLCYVGIIWVIDVHMTEEVRCMFICAIGCAFIIGYLEWTNYMESLLHLIMNEKISIDEVKNIDKPTRKEMIIDALDFFPINRIFKRWMWQK